MDKTALVAMFTIMQIEHICLSWLIVTHPHTYLWKGTLESCEELITMQFEAAALYCLPLQLPDLSKSAAWTYAAEFGLPWVVMGWLDAW